MSESHNSAIFLMLLTLLLFVLTMGTLMVMTILAWRRRLRGRQASQKDPFATAWPPVLPGIQGMFTNRPICWLAIKTRNPLAVQLALELGDPRPCFWNDGMEQIEDHRLFISPPVNGWVLVMGASLPEPAEDVDECFRFIRDLSRELGEVHFFQANRVVLHHAWVLAEQGDIVRAYAWAGTTVWNQGPVTRAERLLGVKCYDYLEGAGNDAYGTPEPLVRNVEKVARLAACWSVDPARVDEEIMQQRPGITGEPFGSGTG